MGETHRPRGGRNMVDVQFRLYFRDAVVSTASGHEWHETTSDEIARALNVRYLCRVCHASTDVAVDQLVLAPPCPGEPHVSTHITEVP